MKYLFKLGLFFSVFISMMLLSCKKDELRTAEERLAGEWAWVRSTGGLMGQTLTPDSEGFEESYLFQKNGIFTHYRDTATLSSSFYWVEKGNSIFQAEEATLLKLGNQDHSQTYAVYSLEFNGENGLILLEECNDCFEIILSRKE